MRKRVTVEPLPPGLPDFGKGADGRVETACLGAEFDQRPVQHVMDDLVLDEADRMCRNLRGDQLHVQHGSAGIPQPRVCSANPAHPIGDAPDRHAAPGFAPGFDPVCHTFG